MRLKELREKAGLTQEELGVKIGKSKTAISNIESGKNGARMSTLDAIAKVLKVEIQDILSDRNALPKLKGSSDKKNGQPVDESRHSLLIELPLIAHTDFSSFAQNCQTSSFPTAPILLVPGHDYQDAAILEIRGNSMAPRYPERARFIIRPIAESSWAHAHGVHIIILKSELLLFKRITSNQDRVLELSNDAAGERIKVTLEEISCLWKVGEGVYYPAED